MLSLQNTSGRTIDVSLRGLMDLAIQGSLWSFTYTGGALPVADVEREISAARDNSTVVQRLTQLRDWLRAIEMREASHSKTPSEPKGRR